MPIKKKDLDPYFGIPLLFLNYICAKCKKIGSFSVPTKCGCKASRQFSSKSVICNQIRFASIREAYRYSQLMFCQERLKIISNLEIQPRFKINVNGIDVFSYISDFQFIEGGTWVVEEVKGRETSIYKLKLKCFKAMYPNLRIRIIK